MDNIFSLDACSGPMWNYICHLCANANRDFRSINLIDCVRSMFRQPLLRFVLVLLNASAISQNLINCIKIFSGNSKRGWRLESVLLRSSTLLPKLGLFSTANWLQARSDAISVFLCFSQRLSSYCEAKRCSLKWVSFGQYSSTANWFQAQSDPIDSLFVSCVPCVFGPVLFQVKKYGWFISCDIFRGPSQGNPKGITPI